MHPSLACGSRITNLRRNRKDPTELLRSRRHCRKGSQELPYLDVTENNFEVALYAFIAFMIEYCMYPKKNVYNLLHGRIARIVIHSWQ
jgi:hypothetical protein